MPTTYLFRVDGTKDNDEYFAAALGCATYLQEVSVRWGGDPGTRYVQGGFRCVRDAPP